MVHIYTSNRQRTGGKRPDHFFLENPKNRGQAKEPSSLSAAAADHALKPRVGTDDGVESTFYGAAYAFVKVIGAGHHFGSCASKMLDRKSCPRERRELPCRKKKCRPAWN